MGVGGIDEMSRASARRTFGVVVRVRRLDETQHMLLGTLKRLNIENTIDRTWALLVCSWGRGKRQHGREAVML